MGPDGGLCKPKCQTWIAYWKLSDTPIQDADGKSKNSKLCPQDVLIPV